MTNHRELESVPSDTVMSRSEDWADLLDDLLDDLPAEARRLAEGMLQREDAELRTWLTGREVPEPTPVRLVDVDQDASDLR